MYTIQIFQKGLSNVPAHIAWYLTDLSESKGKQELYRLQSPQKLKVLKEHALIESAVSSNRIEGVEIDQKRIGTVLFGKKLLKDRNEEEVQGYRKALEWIHDNNTDLKINQSVIKQLHKKTRGQIWDAGKYKDKDSDIIERLPDGDVRLRFKTISAAETSSSIKELISCYNDCMKKREVHPLVLIAAFNLDFLCIHPFRDGNGRVSRLLFLLQTYHAGFEIGKFISLERLIEEHKERYYETLELSSQEWHDGRHDPWHYIGYSLYIMKQAYSEFMKRVLKNDTEPKGAKTDFVIQQISEIKGEFSLSILVGKCPNVSKDMIRKILKDLQKEGKISSSGRGVSARWRKKGNTLV